MKINVKKSFKFIFKDTDWPQKIAIGGLFFFAVFLLDFLVGTIFERVIYPQLNVQLSPFDRSMIQTSVYTVINIPLLAFVMGYVLKSSNNEIKDHTPILPEWGELLDYFRKGIVFYLINLGYYAVIGAIAFLVIFVISVFLYTTDRTAQNSQIFISIVAAIVGILYGIINPFITTFYADNFNWKDAFRVKEIFRAIKTVLPDYLVSMGITIGLWLVWLPIYFILTCTCIGAIIPQFLVFIIHLITVNLFSQTYKEYLINRS